MPNAPGTPPSQIWDNDDLEELRKALIKFFENQRLPPAENSAEDLADDVILRILKILGRLFSEGLREKDQDNEILVNLYEKYSSEGDIAGDEKCATDLRRYAFGIAKHVLQEVKKALRKRPFQGATNDEQKADYDSGSEAEKAVHKTIFPAEPEGLAEKCLHECLSRLVKEKELLLKYYQTDKKKDSSHHQKLADELKMKLNALHVAVHRARKRVEECVRSCMERELRGNSRVWCKE